MKKIIVLLVLLALNLKIKAQDFPRIETKKNNISVEKLKVEVEVIGDIAVTTLDMQFYNPKSNVLEGELVFPLGQNQSVIRFALDVNGSLREAVIVEKEKARVAFETTVRNRIDPALLEQIKGNNYKARIYPIPAKGYKRVVLGYQQRLVKTKNNYYYKLPAFFEKKLKNFDLEINILNLKTKPSFENDALTSFVLDENSNIYKAKYSKKNYKNKNKIHIKIPLANKDSQCIVTNNYFYLTNRLNVATRPKSKVKDVTLLWDNSYGSINRNFKKEFSLLNEYFKNEQNINVSLVLFNITSQNKKKYKIQAGNWSELKKDLKRVIYDGASSFDFLNKFKTNSNEILLFTDGMNTLSSFNLKLPKRTYIINSNVSANHSVLTHFANINSGKYINLNEMLLKEAAEQVNTEPLLFLGANLKDVALYPRKGSVVTNNFSLLGKGSVDKDTIKLLFGYKKQVVKELVIKPKKYALKSNLIKRVWTTNKINDLFNNQENKEEIISLSKKNQVISPYTSLIILDGIEDYVQHNITPPKDMVKEFEMLKFRRFEDKKRNLSSLQNRLFEEYDEFYNWFDKTKIFQAKIKKNNTSVNSINTPQVVDSIITTSNLNVRTVTGVVSDESGFLPGAQVLIKGTTRGAETDFDGNFSIEASLNDVLQFSFVGMQTKELQLQSFENLSIVMENDENILEEVVVTGYGISNALESKTNGLSISSQTYNKKNDKRINTNTKVIYIVDGLEVKNEPNFKPNDIAEVYVLNSKEGNLLFGLKGANGVVVYITKKGKNNNLASIESFENLVKDKIELKGWNPNTPYLKELQLVKADALYAKYLTLREKYATSMSFFIDVADFFYKKDKKDKKKLAIKILTNIVENDIDNYELLRALAYKFEEFNEWEKAVFTYKEILKLRPEDVQSYRDLALALEQVGRYQESLDLLYKIVNGELIDKDKERRFKGVELIALTEMNRLITLSKDSLQTAHINKNLIKKTPLDIKVVIDWNHNDTDIDLWITDPLKEKCYYKHKRTKIGGLMSEDMTEGFGPEQFILKKAIKGTYKIQAKYYASQQQKISGPTFLKVTIFKNYGTEKEERTSKLLRLSGTGEVISIGNLKI